MKSDRMLPYDDIMLLTSDEAGVSLPQCRGDVNPRFKVRTINFRLLKRDALSKSVCTLRLTSAEV